jgi:hypothetical protein
MMYLLSLLWQSRLACLFLFILLLYFPIILLLYPIYIQESPESTLVKHSKIPHS